MHIDGYVHALDARWGGSGVLPDAGLLVHILDGWEDHGAFGNLESTDQSSSLLFAANGFLGGKIPIYHGDSSQPGIILRPAATTVLCGKGGDSGGHCTWWCPSVASLGDVWTYDYPGDGCGGSWRPADIPIYLRRQTAWQLAHRRLEYNEFIYDGGLLRQTPLVVEAYFGRAHEQRRQFMSSNPGMSPPLLELDLMNWEAPLSCVVGAC